MTNGDIGIRIHAVLKWMSNTTKGINRMEFDRVREIIADILGCDIDRITMDAALAEDLEADSLSAVEILMALEEETGITIADSDAVNFKTIADIMNYLEDRQA